MCEDKGFPPTGETRGHALATQHQNKGEPTDLLPQPLLVAHDGRGVVRVLLLQVFQEGLPLLVHVGRLHGQDLSGATGAT